MKHTTYCTVSVTYVTYGNFSDVSAIKYGSVTDCFFPLYDSTVDTCLFM